MSVLTFHNEAKPGKRMKSICLSIFLVFCTTSIAQDKTPNTSATELRIIKSKLDSIFRVDTSRRDPPPELDRSSHVDIIPPSYEWRAKAELEVQNTGSKRIESIVWQFLLIVETNPEKKIQSYLIRSKKEIRPGETVKVTGWIKGAYLKELRKDQRAGLLRGQAEIKGINYED
jgi:hypothetical protein